MGIRMFEKKFRKPIYSIYGFVRFADEIVDTFEGVDKRKLLQKFREDTFSAIHDKVSLNPVLHSFQKVFHDYQLQEDHINAFLDSMEMDLTQRDYNRDEFENYIYGSAEVVGLMCLDVFVQDKARVRELTPYARALGSAFQKINFLRDIKSDFIDRGRSYFPNVDVQNFDESIKKEIEIEIKKDFDMGYIGINLLPNSVRFGVYLAYVYYINLFNKICNSPANELLEKRIRVRNRKKLYLLTKSSIQRSFSML